METFSCTIIIGRLALVGLVLMVLAGCVTPSTWMVSESGQMVRCEAHGWGMMGVATAGMIHKRCVDDFKKIGYVPLPDATLGIKLDPNATAAIVEEVFTSSPAAEAGLRSGDRIIAADDQSIQGFGDFLRWLSGKHPGEKATFMIERDGGERSTHTVTLSSREGA